MHFRNPYATPPDFTALAGAYPALKPHLIWLSPSSRASTINFQDDASQRCLTEALLACDFGIRLRLPKDRLCPPVPNRLNYVLWIQDIIRAASPNQAAPIRGVDVGTGASAIYPLLACRLETSWEFIATDIDDTSVNCARLNVDSNDLSDRIKVLQVTSTGPILPLSGSPVPFDFTMCNPPFYGSAEEIARSADKKEFAPSAVCTGADVEMITPGGESTFVRQMVSESLTCGTQCRWYTSMLGKMSSLFDVVSLLREHSIDNYAITEFVQGQTRRWAVAWSFGDFHLPDSIARIPNRDLQSIMPSRNTISWSFPHAESAQRLNTVLESVLAALQGVTFTSILEHGDHQPSENNYFASLLVQTKGNTWSRTARRKGNRTLSSGSATLSSALTAAPPRAPLLCRVGILRTEDLSEGRSFDVRFQWLQGKDRSLYDSFCSHVSRKIASGLVLV